MKQEAQDKSYMFLKKRTEPFKLFVPKGKNYVIHSPGIHIPSTFEASASFTLLILTSTPTGAGGDIGPAVSPLEKHQ